MSSLRRKTKAPRRPPLKKMPDSAFFEDRHVEAIGHTARWRPLWIVSAAFLVFVISAYLVYSHLWLVLPGEVPEHVLSTAKEANTLIPDPDAVVGYRTLQGYRVFIFRTTGSPWRYYFSADLARSGDILRVTKFVGDPRPVQKLTLAAGTFCGLISFLVIWANRRQIVSRFRGKITPPWTP